MLILSQNSLISEYFNSQLRNTVVISSVSEIIIMCRTCEMCECMLSVAPNVTVTPTS
jgi:hypothetical protein